MRRYKTKALPILIYWLKAKVSKEKKLIGMFVIGNLLIVLGLILGTNSIVAFFASSLLMRIFFAIPTSTGNFKQWLYSSFFASFQIPQLASLAFALSYLTIWILLLSPLFYKKIFIKI